MIKQVVIGILLLWFPASWVLCRDMTVFLEYSGFFLP